MGFGATFPVFRFFIAKIEKIPVAWPISYAIFEFQNQFA